MQRTPFIVQCALLYALMSCPLLLTASLPAAPAASLRSKAATALLGLATAGLSCQVATLQTRR